MRTIGLTFPKGKSTKGSKVKEEVVEETKEKEKITEEPEGENDEVQE